MSFQRLAACLVTLLSLAAQGCGTTPGAAPVGRGPGVMVARAEGVPAYPAIAFSTNEAELFYDQDTFTAMEALLMKAQRSIAIDYYIFGGPTAQKLADLLIAKHRAGLDVHVLVDGAFGKIPEMRAQTKPVFDKLKAAGVPIAIHAPRPLAPKTTGTTIDHNKYFVIDSSEALVGSMNLATKFVHYHDLMVRVKGPVARDLAAQHAFDWFYAMHPEVPVPLESAHVGPATADAVEGPLSQVRLVGTGIGRKTGLEALLPLLAGAKRSIHVQMHELGPGPALDALVAARDRGVDVKLLLDPGIVDPFVPVIHRAPHGVVNAVALDALLKAHMDVRLYRVGDDFTTAHMKLAVVDARTVFAGSINWTTGGFTTVAETDLELHGGRPAAQAEAQFQRDWQGRGEVAEPPSAIALQLCKLYQRLGS